MRPPRAPSAARRSRRATGSALPSAIASCCRSRLKRASSPVCSPIAIDHDVVVFARRRPEAVDAARGQQLLARRSGRAAPARCRRDRAPPCRIAGDRGSPGSGPSAPTRQRRTSSRCSGTRSASGTSASTRRPMNAGSGSGLRAPVDRRGGWPARPRMRQQRLRSRRAVLEPQRLLQPAVGPARTPARRSSLIRLDDDVDHARRVEDVHGALAVLGRDLHRRVLPAGGRAADEQRQLRCRAAPSPARRTPSRRATA